MTSLRHLTALTRVKDPEAKRLGYFSSMSGKPCYYLAPEKSYISLRDIAYTLAKTPRWGARTQAGEPAFSVAQHTMLVVMLLPVGVCFRPALLHDASEAYLGDVPSPLKHLMPEYQKIEKEWSLEIGRRAGLGAQLAYLNDETKIADLCALHLERRWLMENTPESWEMWGDRNLLSAADWEGSPFTGEDLKKLRSGSWQWAAELLHRALQDAFPNFDEANP